MSDGKMEAYKFVHPTLESAVYPISAPYPACGAIDKSMMSVTYEDLVNSFPILLVNVKTGTSFYRIDSPTEFVRVGGSSIGASTIHALGKTLTSYSPSMLLKLGAGIEGPSSADLLVEDIYGGDCSSIGLPGSIIASCFGKTGGRNTNSAGDLAKSVIDLMCINTAQLTNLHAQLNGCKSAVIVGAIGNEFEITECIQRVLNILSGPSKPLSAVFFKQAKYLGCLGAMLRRECLIDSLSSSPVDTATMIDGVDEETYTKLRVSTPPGRVANRD